MYLKSITKFLYMHIYCKKNNFYKITFMQILIENVVGRF